MSALETILLKVVRWRGNQEECDIESYLTHDFTYDDGLGIIGLDDFLSMRRMSGPYDELSILDIAVAEKRAAVMFEGVDTVTLLFHRWSWMIVLEGTKLKQITSCTMTLTRPSVRIREAFMVK